MRQRTYTWFALHPRVLLLLPAALLAALATVLMHSVAAQSPYNCVGWSAWTDRMAGPAVAPTLHVQGNCTFRFAGYRAELRPQLPPGADPNAVLLDLVVHAPTGLPTPAAEGATLSYTTSVTGRYETVLLLPDHIAVPVSQHF